MLKLTKVSLKNLQKDTIRRQLVQGAPKKLARNAVAPPGQVNVAVCEMACTMLKVLRCSHAT